MPPGQFTGRGGLQPFTVRSNYQAYRSPYGPQYESPSPSPSPPAPNLATYNSFFYSQKEEVEEIEENKG